MRKTLIAGALAASIAAPLAAQNAPAQQPAQANQQQLGNTAEDRARAGVIFRTFSIALNSDKVETSVKNQLMGCLYNNSMRRLSLATGDTFAKNKGLDPKKPEQVYAVAARICGVQPAQAAAQPVAPAPVPTQAAQGR